MNKVILVGRLGQDAEVYKSGDKKLVTMSIATSERFKDKEGKYVEKTEWHKLVSFRPGIVALTEKGALSKGSLINVEGMIRTRKYQDKDGKDRNSTEVVVGILDLLQSTKPKGDTASAAADASAEPAVKEEAPF